MFLSVYMCARECVCVYCTEPAAAPRSEQSDPEAVVRLEAGRKNINLLYYSCARKTISAIRTQGICACLLASSLLCICLISDRLPDVRALCTKMQPLSFDSSKSCRMWRKKRQPKSEIWLRWHSVFLLAKRCEPV